MQFFVRAVSDFICDVCFVIICSSSLLLLVPRKAVFVTVKLPGFLHLYFGKHGTGNRKCI